MPSAASRGARAVATSAAAPAEALPKPEAETLLGLDRYAALAAALEREPKRRAEILREHGVTGAEADASAAEWSTRFAADLQLRRQPGSAYQARVALGSWGSGAGWSSFAGAFDSSLVAPTKLG